VQTQIPVEIGYQRPDTGTCVDAEPFALQVTDISMEPEFARGCIVIIDPTGRATAGAYVLAELDDGFELGCLLGDKSAWHLVTLTPGAKKKSISLEQIRGVVTQRAGRRRSYFKRYG
jgi:DNA polymerase V